MAQGNCDNSVFHIDELVVDGIPIKIEESSATVSGLAGFENEIVVTAGDDDDAVSRKKVARIIKAKAVINDPAVIEGWSMYCNASLTLRDTHSGKRIHFSKASFMKLGDVGGKSVDFEMAGISKPIYL